MKRHKDVLIFRKPELLGKARIDVTETEIMQWFADIQSFFSDKCLNEVIKDQRRCFNFDETSIHMGTTIFILPKD